MIGPPADDGSYTVDHSAAIFLVDPGARIARALRAAARRRTRSRATIAASSPRTEGKPGARTEPRRPRVRRLQHLLPQHGCRGSSDALARRRIGFMRALIRAFLRTTRVDMTEAAEPDPPATRPSTISSRARLRAGARPLDADPRAVALPGRRHGEPGGPHRGRPAAAGQGPRLLLPARCSAAMPRSRRSFAGGDFATIYLAPYNYHRIHMPLAGTLRSARFIPGDLFSVNAATARAACPASSRATSACSAVSTRCGRPDGRRPGRRALRRQHGLVWHGDIRAAKRRECTRPAGARPVGIALERGAEIGRFNMGSTVIVLFGPAGTARSAGRPCAWASASARRAAGDAAR